MSNDFGNENLEAKKTCGDERKKSETFILANGTNRWTMMAKISKFNNSSGETLVMDKKVFKHLLGKEWLNVDNA